MWKHRSETEYKSQKKKKMGGLSEKIKQRVTLTTDVIINMTTHLSLSEHTTTPERQLKSKCF